MLKNRWALSGLIVFTLFFLLSVLEIDAWARAGGGRSMGSRGSRSYTPPRSTPAPAPANPSQGSRQFNTPAAPAPSPFGGGGFLRSMAGGIIGRDARRDALSQPRVCRRGRRRYRRRHRDDGYPPDRSAVVWHLLVYKTAAKPSACRDSRWNLLPGITVGGHQADGPVDTGV